MRQHRTGKSFDRHLAPGLQFIVEIKKYGFENPMGGTEGNIGLESGHQIFHDPISDLLFSRSLPSLRDLYPFLAFIPAMNCPGLQPWGFWVPNPGVPNPGIPNHGIPNPGIRPRGFNPEI
jgi:hypothetical protein